MATHMFYMDLNVIHLKNNRREECKQHKCILLEQFAVYRTTIINVMKIADKNVNNKFQCNNTH